MSESDKIAHHTDLTGSATRLKTCRYGRMLFLHRDIYVGQSLDLYGEFSESESRVFATVVRPGDVVIEVGANIGAHTVHLAGLAGTRGVVYAFEPQRVLFQLLCANVALNERFNVRTFHAAVGREPGQVCVPSVDYRSVANFGGYSLPGVTQGEVVPLVALDGFALPSLRLLKIDVEGMELDVLQGARQLIAAHQPIIYVENDRRESSRKILGLLDEYGYNVWWHLARLFNKDNFAGNSRDVYDNIGSSNLLCLPKRLPIVIAGLPQVSSVDDWFL